jgi:hypothetical protein
MLSINNEKAIALAADTLRKQREAAFSKNDIRIQNSIADGDESLKAKAVAYRDYLRDIPVICDGKKIEELRNILEKGLICFEQFSLGETD